jgi:acyl transferase domain-containing protein/SAM-dependent methyltransferase/acyl carrier protein
MDSIMDALFFNAVRDDETLPVTPMSDKPDSIAIVGAVCRLPGGIRSIAGLADALAEEATVLGPLPADLFNRDMSMRSGVVGGLIDDVFDFDPLLFGISPREAQCMEPQQRLALKLSWELFEAAGIPRGSYANSKTAVILGVSDNSYSHRIADVLPERDRMYLPTGNAANVISGRVSFCFNLSGPSLVIDSACSSSLVSIALATEALRAGKCDQAIAGGFNVMLDAARNQILTEIGMLSPEGVCRVFDARANGYVRAEGAGLVLLKRLSDAERDGDNILGILRGVATNHNAMSAGLTVPSGNAQQDVMRDALSNAGMSPSQIDWIEAHGTGTSLGDPIEFEAISSVYGDKRDAKSRLDPFWVSSIKSQFGHTEAAAGVVSILKALTVFRSRTLSPQYGLLELNPAIAQVDTSIAIPRAPVDLAGRERLVAAVNAFGFSGTNASIIVEAPPKSPNAVRDVPCSVLAVSAHSRDSLTQSVADLKAFVDRRADVDAQDVAAALNLVRSAQKHRAVFDSSTRHTLTQSLAAYDASVASGRARPSVVFLFPGQGAQYRGMARSLHSSCDIFATEFDLVTKRLSSRIGVDIKEIMWNALDDSLSESTVYTQAALFAYGYALARTLAALGVTADYLIGHSVGELVACTIAGLWDIEDACDIVLERARLMDQPSHHGRMLAVRVNAGKVKQLIREANLAIEIAAINEEELTTVSGCAEDISHFARILSDMDITSIELTVRYRFHSMAMHGAATDFARFLQSKKSNRPQMRIVSTLTGQEEDAIFMTPGYWQRQMLEPVNFFDAAKVVANSGPCCFIELGGNSILSDCVSRSFPNAQEHSFVAWEGLSSRLRKKDFVTTLGELFTLGINVEWSALFSRKQLASLFGELPAYPTGKACTPPLAKPGNSPRQASTGDMHFVVSPNQDWRLAEHEFSIQTHEYVQDHVIFGEYLAPGAMHCVYALDAQNGCYGDRPLRGLRDIQFTEAAICRDGVHRVLQTVFQEVAGKVEFATVSFVKNSSELADPQTHAIGEVKTLSTFDDCAEFIDRARNALRTGSHTVSGEEFYARFASMASLVLGPSFRWCRSIELAGGYAIVDFERSAGSKSSPFSIEPGLLDACFQVIGALPLVGLSENKTYVPFAVRGVTAAPVIKGSRFTCYARAEKSDDASSSMVTGEAVLVDEKGEVVLRVDGLTVRQIEQGRLLRHVQRAEEDCLYSYALDEILYAGVCGSDRIPVRERLAADQIDVALGDQRLIELVARISAERVHRDLSSGRSFDPALPRLWRRIEDLAASADDARNASAEFGASGEQLCSLTRDQIFSWARTKASANHHELALLELGVTSAEAVLRGDRDGVSVLFPEGDASIVENVYLHAPMAKAINRQIVDSILMNIDTSRKIRILEIGAGTGSTTSFVLDALSGHQFEYCFTDISPLLVARAAERFAREGVSFSVLDIERDVEAQGFQNGTYDVVIAANVLHATKDLNDSVARVNELIRQGGLAFLLEGNGQQAWLDLTFGLTDGWWRFEDQRSPSNSALINHGQWTALLESKGFAVAPVDELEQALSQVVYVAQKLVDASQLLASFVLVGDSEDIVDNLASLLRAQSGCHVEPVFLAPTASNFLEHITDRIHKIKALHGDTRPCTVVFLSRESHEQAFNARDYGHFHDAFKTFLPALKALKVAVAEMGCSGAYVKVTGAQNAFHPVSFECAAIKTLSFETLSEKVRYIEVENVAQLRSELLGASSDACTVFADGKRAARRIVKKAPQSGDETKLDESATYLISGGSSPLAMSVVKWIVDHGGKRIDLLNRQPVNLESREWSSLRDRSVTVVSHRCDVRDKDMVRRCVEEIERSGKRVDAVFHLAGVLDNRLIEDQTLESLDEVASTKVLGAFNLIHALKEHGLSRFVAYTTAASVIGSPGQANHAIANALLDDLVARLPPEIAGVTIQWGPWDEIGAAARDDELQKARGWGVVPFLPRFGERLTHHLLSAQSGCYLALDIDWAALKERAGRVFVVREAVSLIQQGKGTARKERSEILAPHREELLALDKQEAISRIAHYLAQLLASALDMEADSLSIDDRVHDIGLDSLIALELKGRIKSAYQIDVPAKIFLDNISLGQLSENVFRGLGDSVEKVDQFIDGAL